MTAVPAPSRGQDLAPAVIEQAKRGDQDAFAAVIRHYDAGLRALAYRLLGDRDRMDDALQNAYVNAYRALPRFRGHSKVGTWLYRIAYNACVDELERSRRAVQVPLEDVAEPADPRASVAETVESRRDLVVALSQLAPEDRAAVLLVDAQGFDYREAGEVLGVPGGTIASRLNRARSALRRALPEHPEGVAEA
jgi:RNA polymerase sigma-70 factor (ECF subfamily)